MGTAIWTSGARPHRKRARGRRVRRRRWRFGGFRRGIDEDTLRQVANLTGGTYEPAETAAQLEGVFEKLPTNLITKLEPVEVSVGFLGLGFVLAAVGLLLGRAWRPLP
jgi:hypothetical protein